ncbi:hypothetical protein F5878DRAFT_667557 [Lentinula raphanica]|uniref:Uncharacterized protein n=1 Tax=Lentinula raphanica TaxID=153919 RepID=A0AA38NVT4_9AGAR|nr:hypothetical protein F5878DRAFT_667557 [Lentinula raphanica]
MHISNSKSASPRTVLERAQVVASSSDVETYPEPPRIEPDLESLSRLINTDDLTQDEDEALPEDGIDSLMAEGIGEDDMDDMDNVSEDEEEEEFGDNHEHGQQSQSQDASAQQQQKKKRIRKPYPTWFRAALDEVLSQIKADHTSLAG